MKDYEVQFFSEARLGKRLITVNPWLTQFICDWNKVDTCLALLSSINQVLNGSQTSAVEISQGEQVALITQIETKIYEDLDSWSDYPSALPVYSLPTKGFKEIVERWKNYLKV